MGRAAKHNWAKLFLEYCQGKYKSAKQFAEKKKINYDSVKKEFRKLQVEAENGGNITPEKRGKKGQKISPPKEKGQNDLWQNLKAKFTDWPEDKLQAYLVQLEDRKAELEGVPFEELTPEESAELGRVRRERRAILSDPDPEKQCKRILKNGQRCRNPVERGKQTCWNHGGAPGIGCQPGQKHALKHGFYGRIMPDDPEIAAIIEEIDAKSPLEMLWDQIVLQYAAIARAQRIMYVKDREEMIKELKKTKSQREFNSKYDPNDPDSEPLSETFLEEEYEFQFAWDRHATFLTAQSKAMATLERLIARYEAMANDEQKLKVAKLKQDMEIDRERLELEKKKVEQGSGPGQGDTWADLVAEDDDDDDDTEES